MAEADLLEEIEELKDKIDNLNYDIENIKEEKDEIESELTDKLETIKQETEDDWKSKLKNQEKESNKQLKGLINELDEIRSAFSGDTGGWEVKEDKNENIFYKNSKTGESTDEIPQSLYIADLISRADEAETLKLKYKELEAKYKKNDLIKKEFELLNNKIKTEINSLRSIDRLWKESANAVFINLNSVKSQFDSQIDQIVDGFGMFQKSAVRMGNVIQPMDKVRIQLAKLQKRISQQDSEIAQLNSKVVVLQNDIDEKSKKIARLSEGLEEEVERLMRPMREKLAENMLVIMKDKVSRAQERRDLSDLWPSNVMMPTLLMRYRAVTEPERIQRIEVAKERQASIALAIEIRANVAESKMWEVKYDDYGRQIYEHQVTLETVDVEPEIMSYQPPPGRDVQGNILPSDHNNIDNWTLMSDYKGIVYYKNKYTDEISYTSPNAYSRIPPGKTTEELVADAAKLLLLHIKGKIEKHIIDQKCIKNKLLNPLTVEEKKKKEKDRLRAGLEAVNEAEDAEEEKLKEDLSLYKYDIETVEMLAMSFDEKKSIDNDPSGARVEIRKFMSDPEQVRNFDPEQLTGPTLIEVDFEEITVPQLREIVEKLATNEEKIEARLKRVRENLRDFSYILMEKAVEYVSIFLFIYLFIFFIKYIYYY
jgi:septal ring factor EnvC (AmiA/AmiB activator)